MVSRLNILKHDDQRLDAASGNREKAVQLAAGFAERAAAHDRAGSFPFANFQELSDAGLLALTGFGAGSCSVDGQRAAR